MRITAKRVQVYIDGNGSYCLFCDANSLVAGAPEVSGEKVVVGVVCKKCSKQWQNVFELTGVFRGERYFTATNKLSPKNRKEFSDGFLSY